MVWKCNRVTRASSASLIPIPSKVASVAKSLVCYVLKTAGAVASSSSVTRGVLAENANVVTTKIGQFLLWNIHLRVNGSTNEILYHQMRSLVLD